MALPKGGKYSAEEFLAVFSQESNSDIYELIDGSVYNMASPNIVHQRISMGLSARIYGYISAKGGKCSVFAAPTDVRLNDDTVVVPDIFVACDPDRFDSQKYNGAPDWIIEIVSSDRDRDMFVKLNIYKYAGVREYWIIDPKYERTVVYYFENEKCINIFPFDKPVPVNIYGGELEIDIRETL